MSVYAKMPMKELPNSCTECHMGKRYGCVGDVFCNVLKDYFTGNVRPPYKERPDECPLVEMVEIEEVRHGKWIPYHIKHETWNEFGYRCSLCNAEIDEDWFKNMISTKRCPYCDAKMSK